MQGEIERQLELLPTAITAQPRHSRTPQQEAWFQAKLADARNDRCELESIGRQLYSDFADMLHCSLERYKEICLQWHESKGHKPLEITPRVGSNIPKKAIRQWSIEAKRRKRLSTLHKRIHRMYSFPEYFHQAIQEQLLTNPDYYGVCPLPSEFACKYYPPNLRQIAAIEKENESRRLEIQP